MSSSVRTRGLVLRQFAYSDTSQIAWIFTRDEGIVSLLARGSLRLARRSSSFPAPFDLAGWYDLVYRRRQGSLHLATEGRLIEGFDHLRRNLDRYLEANVALELMLRMFEFGDPHPEFLRGALSYLKLLGVGEGRIPLRLHFYSRVLSAAGLAPSWSHCAECQRSVVPPYRLRLPMGLLCEECQRSPDEPVPPPVVDYLGQQSTLPWGRVPTLDPPPALLRAAGSLLLRILLYHLERPLKSLRYLRD